MTIVDHVCYLSGGDSTLDNALSMHRQFGLDHAGALHEVRQVVAVIDTWREAFGAAGARARDVAALEAQIDRPFLLDQRRAPAPLSRCRDNHAIPASPLPLPCPPPAS